MSPGKLYAEMGRDPVMEQHPVQGGVEILMATIHATETVLSSSPMNHLDCMQTFLYLFFFSFTDSSSHIIHFSAKCKCDSRHTFKRSPLVLIKLKSAQCNDQQLINDL